MIWFISAIWSSLSAAARFASRTGMFRTEKLDCRVISVGNLQVGGAGKTPLVAVIGNEAITRGLSVCILCRGYGGNWEKTGGIILPADQKVEVANCGDEAALLHDLVPGAVIAVGANRLQQFRAAKAKTKIEFDLVLIDDGFQNWKIKKDLEVVAVTSCRRYQVVFREWWPAIKRADLIVWTKGEEAPFCWGKPIVKVRYKVTAGRGSAWLVTGVADGTSALRVAKDAGFDIKRHISFPDHAIYERESIFNLLNNAKEQSCSVAITGKDWVKWREFGISKDDVVILEPSLVFEEGRDFWNQTLWGG